MFVCDGLPSLQPPGRVDAPGPTQLCGEATGREICGFGSFMLFFSKVQGTGEPRGGVSTYGKNREGSSEEVPSGLSTGHELLGWRR